MGKAQVRCPCIILQGHISMGPGQGGEGRRGSQGRREVFQGQSIGGEGMGLQNRVLTSAPVSGSMTREISIVPRALGSGCGSCSGSTSGLGSGSGCGSGSGSLFPFFPLVGEDGFLASLPGVGGGGASSAGGGGGGRGMGA